MIFKRTTFQTALISTFKYKCPLHHINRTSTRVQFLKIYQICDSLRDILFTYFLPPLSLCVAEYHSAPDLGIQCCGSSRQACFQTWATLRSRLSYHAYLAVSLVVLESHSTSSTKSLNCFCISLVRYSICKQRGDSYQKGKCKSSIFLNLISQESRFCLK